MTPRWEALTARARGLGTHLLSRSTMAALAGAPDPASLAALLEAAGITIPRDGGAAPGAVELGIRRAAAADLRTLARWLGSAGAPQVIFDDEDRRSLRAMLRGAVAGAAADARLAGLIPTPGLPVRELAELARQPRASDIAALLAAWAHPAGAALLAATVAPEPDPLQLELALDRWFANRAHGAARQGGPAFRKFIEQSIDLDNARTALLLAGSDNELPADTFFLTGGRNLPPRTFRAAAGSGSSTAAAALLAGPLAEDGLGELIRRHAADPARLDEALLGARERALGQEARRDPLGAAPVLAYLLRLRAQTAALRRLLWGMELGVPPAMRIAALEGAV